MTPLSLHWYMVFFRFDARTLLEIGYVPLNNSPDALHGHGTQIDAAMNIEADDTLIFAAPRARAQSRNTSLASSNARRLLAVVCQMPS